MQVENILQLGLPLIILGDFNYILNQSNKQECKPFQVNTDMREFSNFIWRARFINLGFKGLKYMWCNNKADQAHV